MSTFAMAGGGTGGHVMPALAVARELVRRGHGVFFIGTRSGMEAKLVPDAGFPIEWINIGGLNRVGWARRLKTLMELPGCILYARRILRAQGASAVFSMGGFVAGPVMIAARLLRLPLVVMEPNALPGFTNRKMAGSVAMALVNFPETSHYFPEGRAQVTGVPVREEFFHMPDRMTNAPLTILVTGGSRGSRTLNKAAIESFPLFAQTGASLRFLIQTGEAMEAEVRQAFQKSELEGEVSAFIKDMPAAFGLADIVVARSGAGTVSEIAAAGRPAILVPFPFAADDHQTVNAQALARKGAARLVPDSEMNGERLFTEVRDLGVDPEKMRAMTAAVVRFARPGAALRAADALEDSLNVKKSGAKR